MYTHMFTSLLNSALLAIEKDFKVDSNIDRYLELFKRKMYSTMEFLFQYRNKRIYVKIWISKLYIIKNLISEDLS